MKIAFSAKVASFSDDDEYGTLLAFADDPFEPVNYVMLGLANEPDEQDIRLGLGTASISRPERCVSKAMTWFTTFARPIRALS